MLFISCFASFLLVAAKVHSAIDDARFQQEIFLHTEKENDPTTETFLDLVSHAGSCELESRNLIFVSTVDGKLNCLNALTGQLLWSTESSWPLVSSSISSVKNVKDFANVRFIPSLDGSLYRWNGENLESVPLTIEQLLGSIKRLPDGSFITGGKEIIIYGLDINSGQLCYECSTTGCQAIDKNENIKEKDILLFRRIQNTVRVVQPSSGSEKWNYSVGKFEIDFASKEANSFHDCRHIDAQNWNYESVHFKVQQGIVTNSDPDSSWKFQLSSPITAAWRMENDSVKPMDIFRQGLLDELPDLTMEEEDVFMYLGIHDGQMYIQRPPKMDYHGKTFSTEVEVVELPHLHEWRPLITTPSRTPSLNNEISKLTSLDYPYDNGFVLVSNFSTTALSVNSDQSNEEDNSFCDINDEENDKCVYQRTSHETDENVVPLSIRDWWKEICALSIMLAIMINLGCRVVKRKLHPTDAVELASISSVSSAIELAQEETESSVAFVERKKHNSISIATDTTEIGLSDSTTTLANNIEYNSRYLVDFEHLQCLGQGGFGVVFKAKKKIDDCEYAIKRIYLPQCDEAKEKMMREVKALASLEHPGIVRYFHAWWESPPKDWQMTTDKEQLLKDIPNNSPSYVFSKDWMLEVHSIFGDEDDEEEDKTSANNNRCKKVGVRKKTMSNDPLGKRFNFDTGIEEFISDHKEFDLFRHNDVFYPDQEDDDNSSTGGIIFSQQVDETTDDSFIVFDHSSSTTDDGNSSCVVVKDSDVVVTTDLSSDLSGTNHKRTKTLTCGDSDESDLQFIQNNKEDVADTRPKKRLVGKCCTRTSSCLTEPPLFLYIQMQLCRRSTLKEWLRERTEVTGLLQCMDIFFQIVKAVEYFHGRGMMHRDLKPANIFFSLDGSVKVGDFGLVTAITRPSKGKHKGRSFVDENHTGQVGTQLYMSPEQAQGKPYSQKVDVYSLGLILFELLCYFSTDMERMQLIYRVKHGTLPERLKNTKQGELVKRLISENPCERPEATELSQLSSSTWDNADDKTDEQSSSTCDMNIVDEEKARQNSVELNSNEI